MVNVDELLEVVNEDGQIVQQYGNDEVAVEIRCLIVTNIALAALQFITESPLGEHDDSSNFNQFMGQYICLT